MPNTTVVGAPNIFSQNGQLNTRQNVDLPTAFNWHPYMPGFSMPITPGFVPPAYYGTHRRFESYVVGSPQPPPLPPSRPIAPPQQQPYGNAQQQTIILENPTVIVMGNGGDEPSTSPNEYSYDGYCNQDAGTDAYPSVYSDYGGVPGYIDGNSADVDVSQNPYYPRYSTSYLPFTPPDNQAGDAPSAGSQAVGNASGGGSVAQTRQATQAAVDSGVGKPGKAEASESSYQEAFADIENAWNTGNVELIRKHLHDDDTKIGVLIDRKYAYSISSVDYVQITRDAMKTLDTQSFKFTRLRKAKNGDVTAYGTHVYEPDAEQSASGDDTVPFDTHAATDSTSSAAPATAKTSSADSSATTAGKTMFVSYTLRKDESGLWDIVLVDSSKKILVPSQSTDKANQL